MIVPCRFGGMKEVAPPGEKWYWEAPGWDNPWWEGAIIMLQGGQKGPPGPQPNVGMFDYFCSEMVRKWVNGVDPVKCAPLLQLHNWFHLICNTFILETCNFAPYPHGT